MARVALVDNATLTATQRLLGQIRVKNLDNIDGDIAAFESLLQAVLFFDEVCCLDDYKEEFRANRKQQFSFVRFVAPNEFAYETLLQEARHSTEHIMLSVRGHKIVDSEFRKFFELLQSSLVFNWRLRTSVFYLSISLLADQSGVSVEKYGKLQAMLMSQLYGESDGQNVDAGMNLQDSSGHALELRFARDKDFEVGRDIQSFAAALNWLALRTTFYAMSATTLSMDVVLHPIRDAFLATILHRLFALSHLLTRV